MLFGTAKFLACSRQTGRVFEEANTCREETADVIYLGHMLPIEIGRQRERVGSDIYGEDLPNSLHNFIDSYSRSKIPRKKKKLKRGAKIPTFTERTCPISKLA